MWPDWAIYWVLGNFLKPLATINLPKSPTFKSNFCKGVIIYPFCSEIIFGQLLETFGDFFLVTLVAIGNFNFRCNHFIGGLSVAQNRFGWWQCGHLAILNIWLSTYNIEDLPNSIKFYKVSCKLRQVDPQKWPKDFVISPKWRNFARPGHTVWRAVALLVAEWSLPAPETRTSIPVIVNSTFVYCELYQKDLKKKDRVKR